MKKLLLIILFAVIIFSYFQWFSGYPVTYRIRDYIARTKYNIKNPACSNAHPENCGGGPANLSDEELPPFN